MNSKRLHIHATPLLLMAVAGIIISIGLSVQLSGQKDSTTNRLVRASTLPAIEIDTSKTGLVKASVRWLEDDSNSEHSTMAAVADSTKMFEASFWPADN